MTEITHYGKFVKFYNHDYKMQFLEDAENEEGLADSTIRYYKTIFKNSKNMEKELGKDLYDFNTPEALEYLKGLKSMSKSSIRTYVALLRRYVMYSANVKWGNLDGFTDLDPTEVGEAIALTYKNTLFHREELLTFLEENDLNVLQKMMLLAIYEGIKGRKYGELRCMKIEFLEEVEDGKWLFHVHEPLDENGEELKFLRTIEISEELAQYMIEANGTEMVKFYNPASKQKRTTTLAKTMFLIQSAGRKDKEAGMVDYDTIPRMFVQVQHASGNDNIRAMDIFSSGIGEMVTTLTDGIEPDDEGYIWVGKQTWGEVAYRYNISHTNQRAKTEFEKPAFLKKFGKFKYTVKGV